MCIVLFFSCVVIYSYYFFIQIGKSLVSRLKDCPQFRSVEIAIQRSGFKVCTVNIGSHEAVKANEWFYYISKISS